MAPSERELEDDAELVRGWADEPGRARALGGLELARTSGGLRLVVSLVRDAVTDDDVSALLRQLGHPESVRTQWVKRSLTELSDLHDLVVEDVERGRWDARLTSSWVAEGEDHVMLGIEPYTAATAAEMTRSYGDVRVFDAAQMWADEQGSPASPS